LFLWRKKISNHNIKFFCSFFGEKKNDLPAMNKTKQILTFFRKRQNIQSTKRVVSQRFFQRLIKQNRSFFKNVSSLAEKNLAVDFKHLPAL
jgi:hypothetical protein